MIAPLICGGIFVLSMVFLAIGALRSSQGEPRPDAPDSWEIMREMGIQNEEWDDPALDPGADVAGIYFEDGATVFEE